MNYLGQRCITCNQVDLKKEKEEKIRAKCAARIIHGAQSGGGRENIWVSSPLTSSCFLPLLPLVRKGSHVSSPADLSHVLFIFFSWYSAAVALSFFNLSFSLQAPSAAQVKGPNLANCCLFFLFCTLEFNTNNAWGQSKGGHCSTAVFTARHTRKDGVK